MQRTNTHCLGRDCAAIETQTVSIHPLDRVPYLSYCTEAVSVEICHKIRDRKRHPCNNLKVGMTRKYPANKEKNVCEKSDKYQFCENKGDQDPNIGAIGCSKCPL